jgi:hypothetical protein
MNPRPKISSIKQRITTIDIRQGVVDEHYPEFLTPCPVGSTIIAGTIGSEGTGDQTQPRANLGEIQ